MSTFRALVYAVADSQIAPSSAALTLTVQQQLAMQMVSASLAATLQLCSFSLQAFEQTAVLSAQLTCMLILVKPDTSSFSFVHQPG